MEKVLPQLLSQSEQAFTTLVSIKANQREQFDTVMEHLVAIRAAVAKPPTSADRWAALRPAGRDVLRLLFEKASANPFASIDAAALQELLGLNATDALNEVRRLHEQSLVKISEASGHHLSVRPTSAGIVLLLASEEATTPGLGDVIQRLKRALPTPPNSKRLAKFAKDAEVPIGLAHFALEQWANEGHVRYDGNAAPFEASLISHATLTFLESTDNLI